MIFRKEAFLNCFYRTLSKKSLEELLPSRIKPVETNEIIKKMLRVALVGFTNAGKSTLINSILGLNLCAASKRPLTTKDYQKVTFVRGDTKIVFVDTPGVLSKQLKKVSPFTPTEKILQEKVTRNIDLVGLIVDSSSKYSNFKIKDHLILLSSFFPKNSELVLILNKVDLIKDKTNLLLMAKKYYNIGRNLESQIYANKEIKVNKGFSQIFMTSALHSDGVEFMVKYFISKAYKIPENISQFKLTSHKDSSVIEERVRASLLDYIKQEIPYKCIFQLEDLSKLESGILNIVVLIKCPSNRVYNAVNKDYLLELITKDCTEDLVKIFNEPISLRLQPIFCGKRKIL